MGVPFYSFYNQHFEEQRVGQKREKSSLTLVLLKLDSPKPQESREWYSNSAPFKILRRVALWRTQYDESCMV
ncbi:hypothetical protein KSP39_PZI002663 [Platanthera zijinensis]|uniref:Uncharacterized protein n=1 Tax=Platanthera zijinensis TaxID=2320716 RepID=A0AAP0GE12_9ASPA